MHSLYRHRKANLWEYTDLNFRMRHDRGDRRDSSFHRNNHRSRFHHRKALFWICTCCYCICALMVSKSCFLCDKNNNVSLFMTYLSISTIRVLYNSNSTQNFYPLQKYKLTACGVVLIRVIKAIIISITHPAVGHTSFVFTLEIISRTCWPQRRWGRWSV